MSMHQQDCEFTYHDIKDFDLSEYIRETGKGNVLFNTDIPLSSLGISSFVHHVSVIILDINNWFIIQYPCSYYKSSKKKVVCY